MNGTMEQLCRHIRTNCTAGKYARNPNARAILRPSLQAIKIVSGVKSARISKRLTQLAYGWFSQPNSRKPHAGTL